MVKKYIWINFLLLTCLVLNGCSNLGKYREMHNSDISTETIEIVEEQKNKEVLNQEKQKDNTIVYIKNYMKNMTLEEKVGQVFMSAFRYNEENVPLTYLDEKTKEIIQSYNLGGVIFFSENIDTIEQTESLIKDMQFNSKIPLFIAIDEEGGKVSRLNNNSQISATMLPGNKILGKTENPELAYKVGMLLGRELSSLGFNMNLAPVADVNTNPNNPVIGERSFGDDPHKVGVMVASMVEGIQDQNISSVVKHFPGHGDTSKDTHKAAVALYHNRERLDAVEFLPFKKGIEENVDGVMLAHISVPKITGNDFPATFSEVMIEDILRSQLQHQKLVITDALEMAAITKHWSAEEAAVLAFQAGADILLMPASLEEAYNGLLRAIIDGTISQDRLDESIKRILTIKYKRGILEKTEIIMNPKEVVGSTEHLKIVEKIYQQNTQ